MRQSSSTVRRSLFVLVIAAVLPTLIAATAALLYAYKEEQAQLHQGVADTTRALALVVDREIARREAIALTLAGSPTLTRGDLQVGTGRTRDRPGSRCTWSSRWSPRRCRTP